MQCLYVDTEADNQVVIGCGITENVDEFAADLVCYQSVA